MPNWSPNSVNRLLCKESLLKRESNLKKPARFFLSARHFFQGWNSAFKQTRADLFESRRFPHAVAVHPWLEKHLSEYVFSSLIYLSTFLILSKLSVLSLAFLSLSFFLSLVNFSLL